MAATHRQWEESRDQFKYWGGALLIHVLFGVLLVGFNWRTQQAIVPQLAINAVVVDRDTLNQLVRQQAAPSPPPEPDTREQEEQEKQRQEQAKQEQLKQEQVQREQLELQRVQEQQRAEVEKQKQLDEQRRVQQAEQQKQKQEAEKKRLADIQQKQREAELKRQAEAETRAQAAREAELKAQMAAEEGRAAAVKSGVQDRYQALIKQHVMRRWIKPPTAKLGVECDVSVTQAVGGTVLSAQVVRCNGDTAVRQSIENAVLSASPLPMPDDPQLFLRTFVLRFKPEE